MIQPASSAIHVDASAVALFGKIPGHGDFVRLNASGAGLRALDEWLQEGMYAARGRTGAADGAQYGFVFSRQGVGVPLIGVMQMSRDRVGRAYPFLCATEVAEPGIAAGELPERLRSFISKAGNLVGDAVSGGVDYRDLQNEVFGRYLGAQNGSGKDQPGGPMRPADLFSELWGTFEDGRKYMLFKNLLAVMMPLGGHVPPGFTLGLRFPLPSSPAEALPFWLRLCTVLSGVGGPGSFFWTEKAEGRTPFLMVFPGKISSRTLPSILSDGVSSELICDLVRMGDGNAARAALELPPALGRVLEDEHATLDDVLRSLGTSRPFV